MSFIDKNDKRNTLMVAHWFSQDLYAEQTASIKNFSAELLEHIYAVSKPERKHPQKYLPQIEIFLVNALMAYWHTDGFMAISKASGEYSKTLVSYRVIVDLIIGSLKKSGWLIEHPGYYEGILGFRTRIEFTEEFIDWLASTGIPATDTKVKKPLKPVTLKSKDGKLMEIPEDLQEEAMNMADQVQVFNDQLEKSQLDLAISEDELVVLNARMRRKASVDQKRDSYLFLNKKYLQRKFNNGTLEDGGRFYNGWWMNVPREWRKYITIDGYKTAELDYSGMHINLLYAKEHVELRGDPYEIAEVGLEFRGVTKQMFIIMFNASSRAKALNAITRSPEIKKLRNNKHPKGIKNFDQYLALLEKSYAPISTYFYSGYGVKLQAQDSIIIESVMKRMLAEHQVTTLPIHDSLIVDARFSGPLKQCMLEEFKRLTGAECEVKEKPKAVYDTKRLNELNKGFLLRGKTSGNDALKTLR